MQISPADYDNINTIVNSADPTGAFYEGGTLPYNDALPNANLTPRLFDGNDAVSAGTFASFDTNNDGVINSSDADYNDLQVWEDLNQDGVLDSGEMQTLAQAGITSISDSDFALYTAGNANYAQPGSEPTSNYNTYSNDTFEPVYTLPDGEPITWTNSEPKLTTDNQYLIAPVTIGELRLYDGNDAVSSGAFNTLDTNNDGVINANDSSFANLQFWEDYNQDGVIESGEMVSMADAGVTQISEQDFTLDTSGNATITDQFDNNVYSQLGVTNVPNIVSGSTNDTIITYDGDQTIWSGDGNDQVASGAGNDQIIAGNGNDSIWGEAGNDTIWVGSGNDVIYGDWQLNATDKSQDGSDDDLIYGGSVAGTGDTIFGGVGNDTIYGGAGNDLILGFANPNDSKQTLDPGESDNDFLYGGAGSDTLLGGPGDDYLDGGAGADYMAGGTGNDTYIVNTVDDQILENPGEGNDTVYSSVTYLLPANVENLYLVGNDDISGTGNSSDNLIVGNSGDNNLDGVTGNDTLIGGAGNDTYYVENANDVVIEQPNQGNDTVLSMISYTLPANVENLNLISFSTPEQGIIDGNDVLVYGYPKLYSLDYSEGSNPDQPQYLGDCGIAAVSNVITEAGGSDSEDTVLDYAIANNLVTTSSADPTELGSSTESQQVQLLESFGYEVTTQDWGTGQPDLNQIAQLVQEGHGVMIATNAGSLWDDPTYNSSLDSDTGRYQANHDVTVTGVVYNADNTEIVGFYLADSGRHLVSDMTRYISYNDLLAATNVDYGYAIWTDDTNKVWNDNIAGTGNSEDNIINGTPGDNTIDGGAGADTMIGGAGNDTYYVDNAGDLVFEDVNGGDDTVISSVSYTIVANIENLTLAAGAGNINATGNSEDNIITGNEGSNVLTAGDGNDTLIDAPANDTLGYGNDTMIGGTGDDTLDVRTKSRILSAAIVKMSGFGHSSQSKRQAA